MALPLGLCRSDAHYQLTRGSNTFANLALAPDGKLLAARHKGGDIELWDLVTRRRTGILTNQGGPRAMGFSRDGRFLASANRDRTGKPVTSFWEVETRQIVRDMPQPAAVASLACSPDGKRLATIHMQMDPRFRLWKLPSGKLLMDLPATEGFTGTTPLSLFSPDGTTLARGENQGQIQLLDLATGVTRELASPMEGNGVLALAFSPDGRLLASGFAWTDSTIRLWDVTTGKPVGRLEGHRGFVEELVFAPDGQTLYSASFDQTIRIWDVARKKQIGRLQGHTGRITGLALCPDGRTLVSCAFDGSIRVWNLLAKPPPPAEATLPVRTGPYGALFTADSRRLITASRTNLVTVWDVATAAEIERIPGLGTNNYSMALSPDERLLAVGGWDGALKVWDLKKQCPVKEWRPHRFPVFELCFLDHGTSLASIAMPPGLQSDLKRWDTTSWREIPAGPIEVDTCFGVAQSPDQQLLALIYNSKPLKVWNSASGRLEATLGSEGGMTPVFSHDGRLVAAALRQRARVWEVGSWRPVAVLEQPANPTYAVAFSPDG